MEKDGKRKRENNKEHETVKEERIK